MWKIADSDLIAHKHKVMVIRKYHFTQGQIEPSIIVFVVLCHCQLLW